MSSDKIGIRELKARLSHHLKRVKRGATLTVTDRGHAIATIAPAASNHRDWIWKMVADGRANWSGGKPTGLGRRVKLKGGALLSDAVLEDRQ